jgi:hypothetical protein
MQEPKLGYRKRSKIITMENSIDMEWKNKINGLQQLPSENIWNGIEKNISGANERLYNIEVMPPASCWERISERLPNTNEFSINPSNNGRSIQQWIKYAAIFTGIILLTTTAINKDFRNNIIDAMQGSQIKAALPDSPYHLNKTSVNKDSVDKKNEIGNSPDSLNKK